MELKKVNNNINVIVPKFITGMTFCGKKVRGERNFFYMLHLLKKKQKNVRPILVLQEALEKSSPVFNMVTKKVGGAKYQIPVALKEGKDVNLGIKWIMKEYKDNKRYQSLDQIIWLAYKGEGSVVKKREARNELGKTQRAFIKFLE